MNRILSDNRHTTGWGVHLKRRLAVPLVLEKVGENRIRRVRKLKTGPNYFQDNEILATFMENRKRIERLESDMCGQFSDDMSCSDILNELEYIRANITLGLMNIAGDLDQVPSSEEILSEALA